MSEAMPENVILPTGDAGEIENTSIDMPLAAIPFDGAYDSRRQRIFDHRVEAQAERSTMIACLSGVNSDLFDTQLVVAETLRQGLAASGASLETIERYRDLIDLTLRLSKQITQVTQLEQRARKANEDAASTKPEPC